MLVAYPAYGDLAMKRLSFLLLPLLFLAACQDMPEPLAPSDDAMLARGASGTIDLIVVLDGSFAPGGGDANRERADEIARGLGLAPFHTYGTALFGFAASVPATQVEALRRNPMVAHVEADQPVSLPEPVFEPAPARATGGGGAEPSSSTQVVPWGIDRTGARENGVTGRGVHVYVLDTGIDPDHPDLKANLGEGHTVFTSSCRGNPKNCPPPPTWHDDHGHGTHVAGTIGAADNGSGVVGVAPGVTLHAVKVLSASGSGSRSGVIAGVDWVAGHNTDRARVANMSIGGAGEKVGTCTANGLVGSTDAYHAALCNARNMGVVFAVSAGNSGADAAFQAPAAFYDAAITVSATSCRFDDSAAVQTCETGTEAFTTWSNWGNRTDSAWPSEGSLPVAIAAPGANVLSTWIEGGHRYASGTSMAAPHVAGGAALVLAQFGGSQAADGSAFTIVRAALLGASECTETWHNVSGNPHSERFLNLRNSNSIDECVEPGDPPPTAPTKLGVVGVTSTTVSIAWEHGSPEEARFEIWQNIGGTWGHLAFVEGVVTYTVEGLSPSTAYGYAVRAVAGGDVSAWSNIVNVVTLADEETEPSPLEVRIASVDCDRHGRCDFRSEVVSPTMPTWDWTIDPEGDYWTPIGRDGQNLVIYFTEPGTYRVTVTVRNALDGDSSASDSRSVSCRTQGNNLRCSPID
jgi:subtilisin